MINYSRGLLAKILFVVLIVAVISLAVSYAFVSIQQHNQLHDVLKTIQKNHATSTNLMFKQQLQEQIITAEELYTLSDLNSKSSHEAARFLDNVWPKIQLSLALSSMAIANNVETYEFGNFPEVEMRIMQDRTLNDMRPSIDIVCHSVCELASTIPISLEDKTWTLSLLSDLAPTIIFLKSVVVSDIGVIAPFENQLMEQNTLKRYITEIMTGLEANKALFEYQLTPNDFVAIENDGLQIHTQAQSYFVWFETIEGLGQSIDLMFINNITNVLVQQQQQKTQIIIIFIAVTLGILITLILASIIPISQLGKLKRVIKLIGAKRYSDAKDKLGSFKPAMFKDEIEELEIEFHHAIDMLENYESELESSQRRLVRQATIDSITGLYTRNVLVDDLHLINEKRRNANIAILFLDLDGFKPVNDNLGHEAGDILLRKIGYRLKTVSNKNNKVYRIGGDEFVISLSSINSHEAITRLADTIIELFVAPFNIYENNISITASIGIAINDKATIDADQLLRFADIAMYQAKEGGKNRYNFFDDTMQARTMMRFTIKNDFIASLEDNQLSIAFQPIVDAKTRALCKLEALCRWNHPVLGFIAPPIFIDVLEESENMQTLFNWIIDKVLNEIEYLDSVGLHQVKISVNLSSSQLENDAAIVSIVEQMESRHIPFNRIELEITETSLITNFAKAKEWIEQVNILGFGIAIDDFGAGYSSLSYLTAFPYDTVKLDRSLLDKIDTDKRQQRIVSSITQMLHGLSVPIVAEGAETNEQFNELAKLGCDFVQGFYISKPISHELLIDFLKQDSFTPSTFNPQK